MSSRWSCEGRLRGRVVVGVGRIGTSSYRCRSLVTEAFLSARCLAPQAKGRQLGDAVVSRIARAKIYHVERRVEVEPLNCLSDLTD